jgi:hypothetical protein
VVRISLRLDRGNALGAITPSSRGKEQYLCKSEIVRSMLSGGK